MSRSGRVAGKVVLITGAARGQGRSHAVRLAEEGADIVALDICASLDTMRYPLATPEDLAQTVKEVEAAGGRIVASKADVRQRDSVEAALAAGLDAFGRLDVVIANAGIVAVVDTSLVQAFVDATDVDLIGVMNTVAVSLPHLGAGASIIVIGSTAGLIKGATERLGSSGGVGYAWSKRMVAQYVEVLALQLAPSSVRINAIHPTNVDTHLLHTEEVYRAFVPGVEHPTREQAVAAFPAMQAMPTPYIDPLDVSHLVTYLASDESRYMTGQQIRLDAGAMLKASPI